MNKRINEVRNDAGLTQQEFAEKIGLTKNYVSLMETGGRSPSDRTISDICRTFRVSESWLRSGEGEMHPAVGEQEELASIIGRILHDRPDSFKQRLLSVLLRLSEEDWEVLEKLVVKMAEEQKKD